MKNLEDAFHFDGKDYSWSVTGEEKMLSTPIFSIYSVSEVNHDGKKRGDFVKIKSPDWVLVLPVFKGRDGKPRFVLTSQFRHGSGKMAIEFPGGLVDEGESAMEAARRELKEETGLSAKFFHLGAVNPNAAFMSNTQNFFIAHDLKLESGQSLDENEEIELLTLPVDETVEKMGSEGFGNGVMMMALGYYLRYMEKDGSIIRGL